MVFIMINLIKSYLKIILVFSLVFVQISKAQQSFEIYPYKEIKEKISSKFGHIAFSENGRYLGSVSHSKEKITVKIWSVDDFKLINSFDFEKAYQVKFNSDLSILAGVAKENIINVWSLKSGDLLKRFKKHTNGIISLTFSKDGKLLASGGYDKIVNIWSLDQLKLIRSIKTSKWIYDLDISEDNSFIAIGVDFAFSLYSIKNGRRIFRKKHSGGGFSVGISPDNSKLVVGGGSVDAKIMVCSIKNGEILASWNPHRKTDLLRDLDFSPDGSLFGTYSQYSKTLRLWDTKTFSLLKEIKNVWSRSFSFCNDGELFASISREGIKIWKIEGTLPALAFERKPKYPANLKIEKISFIETSKNNALDAEENGFIQFNLINQGKGEASIDKISCLALTDYSGIVLGKIPEVSKLKSGKSYLVNIPVSAQETVKSKTVKFKIDIFEKYGFDLNPSVFISFDVNALVPPELQLVDLGISDQSGNAQIEPLEIVEITSRIQNIGQGNAKDVRAKLTIPRNVFLAGDSKLEFQLNDILPGNYKDIIFSAYTNNRATGMPISIQLKEKHKQFDKTITLDLPFYKPQKKSEELIVKSIKTDDKVIGNVSTLNIDVDSDVPETNFKNPDAVAVIIGNRNYQKTNDVEYAINDAQSIKKYLIKTFGYKEGNIIFETNATQGTFTSIFGKNGDYKGKLYNYIKSDVSDIFIYYSGHGVPDPETKKAFIVPVDCDPSFARLNGFSLDIFYENLSKLSTKSTTVVIDACFSGTSEKGNLIKNISPVLLTVENPIQKLTNGIIMTSAMKDQVSSWYPEKKHSLFTYYFLKGIKGEADTNKDSKITFVELQQYINENVPYMARRLNNREQTPEFLGNKEEVIVKVQK